MNPRYSLPIDRSLSPSDADAYDLGKAAAETVNPSDLLDLIHHNTIIAYFANVVPINTPKYNSIARHLFRKGFITGCAMRINIDTNENYLAQRQLLDMVR